MTEQQIPAETETQRQRRPFTTRFDPDFAYKAAMQVLPVLEKYFRVKYLGLEHLAEVDRFLAVGIHGGGMMNVDSMIWAGKYISLRRKPHMLTLAHNVVHVFGKTKLGEFLPKGGMIRASFGGSLRALQNGYALTVYPGGDYEPYRPFTERNQVNFHGRKGYLRLALRAGVPILPVISAGAHETLFVLNDGQVMARALKLDRLLKTHVLPVSLTFPWGLNIGLIPHLPLPAQVTIQVLPPIYLDGYTLEDTHNPARMAELDAHVQRTMQRALDELVADRIPILGKPNDFLPYRLMEGLKFAQEIADLAKKDIFRTR